MNLKSLALAWLDAKREEEAARNRRHEIGQMLAEHIGGKEEGATRADLDGLRVTVTRKITRMVDREAVQEAWGELPEIVKDAFVWKPDLLLKQYRALEVANPQAFAVLARFVTSKQAAPTIDVEEIE